MAHFESPLIKGVKIGHVQDLEAVTGCSVIIFEEGACAGVEVRGGAPGTRETDLLNPENLVDRIHAVLLTGGSAFGLDAASGVMEYLENKQIGFDVGVTKVPIVCGAVLFDLHIGDFKKRPGRDMGYNACLNASEYERTEGNVGAGTGASVGKLKGMEYAMKGGTGFSLIQSGDLKVAALTAVNCLGDVVDPETGKILAGCLENSKDSFADSQKIIAGLNSKQENKFSQNTSIGVVMTNAKLSKAEANKVASTAQNGLVKTIRPAHTMVDGDTIFATATGQIEENVDKVTVLAVNAVENAVLRAVKKAESIHGITSFSELANR